MVFIDKGGVVNGRVLCEKMILNGELYGECCCSTLVVYENGFYKEKLVIDFWRFAMADVLQGL